MKPRLQDLLSVQNWQQESSGDILYVAKVGACVGKWSLKKNSLYLIEFGLEDPYGKFFQIWETSLRLLGEADAGLLNCEPWPPVLCRTQGRCSWSSRRPESERTFKTGFVWGLGLVRFPESWSHLSAGLWEQLWKRRSGFQGAGNLLSYTSDQLKSPKFGSAFCLGYHKRTFRAVETSSYYRTSFWHRVVGMSWPWHKLRLKARIDSDPAFSNSSLKQLVFTSRSSPNQCMLDTIG